MSETNNTAEIAAKISKDIFKHFHWQKNNLHDSNFSCVNKNHVGVGKKEKQTHPTDVVFHYTDPYSGRRVYLNTDLKSYGTDSITSTKLRTAFKSLSMTVGCASESEDWRTKHLIDSSEPYEVRGLLFVYNHDNGYDKPFYQAIDKVDLKHLDMSSGLILHFLGPHDLQRLYSIANDMIRLKVEGELGSNYTFYYPDLVLVRRQGEIWHQPATVESLTGPFTIIRHTSTGSERGCLIYYNREGNTVEEFEYFLDCLSRYQLLDSEESIKIRVTNPAADSNLKSVFSAAKVKYAKAWGFDSARAAILDKIDIDRITSVTSTYNPGDVGWRT